MTELLKAFLNQIAQVKSSLTLSAFGIAALVVLFYIFSFRPKPAARRTAWATIAVIFGIIVVQSIIGAVTDIRSAHAIYHIRVTTVDDRNGVPVVGANVRVSVANEASTASDGSAQLAIPKGSLPADRKVRLFADKDSAFIHGQVELQLGSDYNPSVIVHLKSDTTAGLHGSIQGVAGTAVSGARVTVSGATASMTDSDGRFSFPGQFAPGQEISIHVEKAGYRALTQLVRAGDEGVVILLPPK